MSSNPNVSLTDVADVELAARAATGDEAAFSELYRRNVAAAWRVAQAITTKRDDASDAVGAAFVRVLQALGRNRLASPEHFRPYLLATTRRSAVDLLRKAGRVRRDADDSDDSGLEPDASSASGMAAAFRRLPERWRTAAWLSEVEGMDSVAMAPIFGISPNAAAQLAARATTGLRERYLQLSHETEVDQVCRFTTERLGTYVTAGVSGREADKLDKHLAKCPACSARLEDLKDLGSSLRETMVAIPLSLAALTMSRWHLAFGSLTPQRRVAGMAPFGQYTRPIAVGAAALAAIGIVGATIWGQPRHPSPTAPRVALAAPALATPATIVIPASSSTPLVGSDALASPEVATISQLTPATTANGAAAPADIPRSSPATPNTTTPDVTLPAPPPTTPLGPPAPPTTLPPLPTTIPGVPLPSIPGVPLPSIPAVTLPTIPLTLPTLPKVTIPVTLPVATTLPTIP